MHSHLCSMLQCTVYTNIYLWILVVFLDASFESVCAHYPGGKLSVLDSVKALIDVFKLRNVDADAIFVVVIIAVDVDALDDDDDDGEEIQHHLNAYWIFICKFYDN